MKITKIIREFMEETLSEKRVAANKAARADYDARRKACKEGLLMTFKDLTMLPLLMQTLSLSNEV